MLPYNELYCLPVGEHSICSRIIFRADIESAPTECVRARCDKLGFMGSFPSRVVILEETQPRSIELPRMSFWSSPCVLSEILSVVALPPE